MSYQINPRNFEPSFEISICFIEHDGEILFLLRQEDKPYGNKWNLPGGRAMDGETSLYTCVREVGEETGLWLPYKKFIYSGSYNMRYPKFDFIKHVFRIKMRFRPRTFIEMRAHEMHEWVTPRRSLYMRLVPLESQVIKEMYGV